MHEETLRNANHVTPISTMQSTPLKKVDPACFLHKIQPENIKVTEFFEASKTLQKNMLCLI